MKEDWDGPTCCSGMLEAQLACPCVLSEDFVSQFSAAFGLDSSIGPATVGDQEPTKPEIGEILTEAWRRFYAKPVR